MTTSSVVSLPRHLLSVQPILSERLCQTMVLFIISLYSPLSPCSSLQMKITKGTLLKRSVAISHQQHLYKLPVRFRQLLTDLYHRLVLFSAQ